jgi:hypothetical protein
MVIGEHQLAAKKYSIADIDEFQEMVFERGWTDGFPVFMPTEKKVLEILDYIGRPANDSLGVMMPGEGEVTMEAIAINCAMAGCKKEYVPVVITAMEAILDDEYHLLNSVSTVGGPPLTIISGPVVKKLGFNYAEGAIAGSGHRANGTIARAIRLLQWNVGLARPGELAKCVFAQADRWGHLICERPTDDGNPWEPFHVSVAGLKPEDSAVTVLDAHGTYLGTGFVRTGANLERNIADIGKRVGQLRGGACTVIALNPDAAKMLADAGWSKERFRDTVWENTYHLVKDMRERSELQAAGVPVETHTAANHWARRVDLNDEGARVYHITDPSHLQVMVSGGWGGGHVSYLFTGGNHSKRDGGGLVTKKINWEWD